MSERTGRIARWYPLAAAIVALAASAVVYTRLPERAPTHWNAVGQVDRYGSPLALTLTMPMVMFAIALLAPLLRKIDPRRSNYEKFLPTYYFTFGVAQTLALIIQVMLLATALGYHLPVERMLTAGIAFLFLALGNVMPRVRSNWWIGIRTPWTLSSDRVWMRTHRVAGYLWTGAGLLMLAALIIPRPTTVIVAMSVIGGAAVLSSIAYSYVAWRQERHA
jgi:uncharacterized membrane protein